MLSEERREEGYRGWKKAVQRALDENSVETAKALADTEISVVPAITETISDDGVTFREWRGCRFRWTVKVVILTPLTNRVWCSIHL